MRISKRMMIGLLSGMISLGLMMAWLGFTRTGKNTEESLGTINVTPLSQASTVVEQAQVLETFNLSPSVNVAFVDGENTVEPDASLHWENLYEIDWTTEEEMVAETDRQWELAAEWGYTRPSEAAALIDYLLDSGVIAGTAVPRQFSEIEEILPPRHDGEIAILVGSAGLTSLQEDDAGNWRYFPLASELGQVANGMVIGGQLFFSGADGGFYQWGGEETAERVWEDGAVFDSWHDETSQQTYLATNRGVWLSELAGESRLISTPDLFAWSITQDRNGDLWVSGERTIQDASVKTFNEAGLWESADGTQSVREGVILRLIDGEWISMGVFPDDPIIREIVAGEINGQEMIVARGHKRAYLFDAAKGEWDVLLDQPVSSLLISQDVLYLGTEDSRLLVYRQGDFESLLLAAEADGIFLLDLAMLPDGRLLAGTQAGVYVIDLQSGEIRHTDQRGVSESRTQVGKRAAQMPVINHWCPVFGSAKNHYVWYDIGEHNINGNSTAIEFQMGAYSSNNLDLYPWHSAVGEARKVMWYCDGSQVRARSWKGCNGYDDCYDHMILSDHLNGNGDHVGGGVSCNHDYYAAVWSDIPGYQFQIGRTVGKTDVNGVTTSNNNRYNAAVELVPSDFGDLRAEEESDFPTADVFFRQHVAHTETADQVRSGDWNGEQLPNYEDGDDDGLEVFANGSWQHPESVILLKGETYRFRIQSQSHGAWYWQPQTFIHVYGDWNGVATGFSIVNRYDSEQLIGNYEFDVIIPTDSVVNPWIRITLSQENPSRIDDIWAEDKNTYIMGEIEDYRLTVSGGTDLEVTKIDTADPVMLGDMIDYDITVRNNGPVIANDVRLVDELPAGTEFVSAAGGGFACTQNGGSTVTCLRDYIAVGDAHTVRLRLRTADETIAQVTNVATVSMLNNDLVPENNRDTEVTTIEQLADVAIDKQDSADPVYPDQPFQYILTVRNNGPHTARDVTVTDTVPNGIVLNRATGSGFSCQISGQALRCTRPSLLAGQQVAISVDVLSGDQIGVVTNTAEATTSTPEQIVWNNIATENTTILEITDLEISKTDVQDPVVVGETLQWRLVATNVGPQPAENVVIELSLIHI